MNVKNRIKCAFLCMVLFTALISISCNWILEEPDTEPEVEEVDLVASLPALDFSMIPEAGARGGRELVLADALAGQDFLNAVMDTKMYADAMNEVASWVKANARAYDPDLRHDINQEITISIPGMGDLPLYICSFAYTITQNDLKVYVFFPEPPATTPAGSNPFRMYIWNRKDPEGGFVTDFAWASYDETGTPGAAANDYQSAYFFRVNTRTKESFYYIGGSDAAYPEYGELSFSDAVLKHGYLTIAKGDGAGGIVESILYSDSAGYYVHLDEELGDFESGDPGVPNIGDFHLGRDFMYDSAFTEWPVAFTEKMESWGGSAEMDKMTGYDPASYIPAFDDPLFKLIWPDEWLDVLGG